MVIRKYRRMSEKGLARATKHLPKLKKSKTTKKYDVNPVEIAEIGIPPREIRDNNDSVFGYRFSNEERRVVYVCGIDKDLFGGCDGLVVCTKLDNLENKVLECNVFRMDILYYHTIKKF